MSILQQLSFKKQLRTFWSPELGCDTDTDTDIVSTPTNAIGNFVTRNDSGRKPASGSMANGETSFARMIPSPHKCKSIKGVVLEGLICENTMSHWHRLCARTDVIWWGFDTPHLPDLTTCENVDGTIDKYPSILKFYSLRIYRKESLGPVLFDMVC